MIPHETSVNDNCNGHEWSNTDLANQIDGGGNYGVIWKQGVHIVALNKIWLTLAIFSTLGWGSASGVQLP